MGHIMSSDHQVIGYKALYSDGACGIGDNYLVGEQEHFNYTSVYNYSLHMVVNIKGTDIKFVNMYPWLCLVS